MVKIAILFTGQFRTFDRTWKIIKQNLILPNSATIFIFGESPEPEISRKEVEQKWEGHIGTCYFTHSTRNEEYNQIVNYLRNSKIALKFEMLARSGINPEYVFQSGSILEYYQYMKTFDLMLGYERAHNIKFTHIVRSRLDMVFTLPLELNQFFTTPPEDLEMFKSLGSEKIKQRREENITDVKFQNLRREDTLWTFRKNVVWIGSREIMERLYPLVYFYGHYLTADKWCFNSESQFNLYCQAHNISRIDFLTMVEEEYLTTKSKNLNLIVGTELGDYDPKLVMTIVRGPDFPFDK